MQLTRYVDISAARGDAGEFESGYPMRLVTHTTETTADPASWIPAWPYPSNRVLDYERDTVFRVLRLDRAGKALYNAPGGVSTNTLPCVQYEVNGMSDDVPSWPVEKRKWIASRIAEDIVVLRTMGYDVNLDPAYQVSPGTISMSATENAPQRFTYDQWNAYNGICGHRHVPENDHWDAGSLDLKELAGFIQVALGDTSTVEDEDMAVPLPIYRVKDDPRVFAVDGTECLWIPTWDDLQMLQMMKVVAPGDPQVLNNEIGIRCLKGYTPKGS